MREIRSHRTSTACRVPTRQDHPELLLLTGTPREILARIVPDDPLEIRVRTGRRLRDRFLVLDVDRAVLRTFALCANQAPSWRGRPELDAWLDARVDEALDQLLEEEDEILEAPATVGPDARPPRTSRMSVFDAFAGPLGLDAAALRRACRRFNLLASSDREAFFLLAVEGRSLDSVSHGSEATVTELARRARRGLDALRGAASFKRPLPLASPAPAPL